MKVFNEETEKKPVQVVLLLEAKEAKAIISALERHLQTHKGDTICKRVYQDLIEKAVIW